MTFTKEWLHQCEVLIANGKTGDAVQQLRTITEETGYKKEILQMNARWKTMTRAQMEGTLSSDEKSLQNSRFNKGLLLLLEALDKELDGGKIDKKLFADLPNSGAPYRPVWQTYLPILLTALAIWGISYFAYADKPVTCHSDINLDGTWSVFSDLIHEDPLHLGEAVIIHPSCEPYLRVNGVLQNEVEGEVDFNSKIAGIEGEGEFYMVYENFNGEKGLCKGMILRDNDSTFSIICTDLTGTDKDGKPVTRFRFKRKE